MLEKTCVQAHSDSIDAAQNGQRHRFGLRIAYPEAATEISAEGVLIGSGADADLRLESPVVCIITPLESCPCLAGRVQISLELFQGMLFCVLQLPLLKRQLGFDQHDQSVRISLEKCALQGKVIVCYNAVLD